MNSLSLKAVTFFTLTSHSALTQHVPMYFAMFYTGKDVSGTLGNLGSQKLLHSQDHFTRNSMGTRLDLDPPKKMLEAYTKKNMVALPPISGSAVPKSWSRKKSHSCPG